MVDTNWLGLSPKSSARHPQGSAGGREMTADRPMPTPSECAEWIERAAPSETYFRELALRAAAAHYLRSYADERVVRVPRDTVFNQIDGWRQMIHPDSIMDGLLQVAAWDAERKT